MAGQRITVVGPAFPWRGGLPLLVADLAHRLAAEGHAVRVRTWSRQGPARLLPAQRAPLDAPEAAVWPAEPGALSWRNPADWWRTGARAGGESDLVVVVHYTSVQAPALAAVAARARRTARVVAVCANAVPHERRPGDRALTALLMRAVDGAVVHTAAEHAALAALTDRPVAVAPLPAHLPDGEPRPRAAGARRRVLFFGKVRHYKGVDLLLHALAGLDDLPDVALTVAGEVYPDAADLPGLAGRLGVAGRVRFLPHYLPAADLPALFASADALVLPYRSATASQHVALARRHGLPVVATRVGNFPDRVDDGVDGLLCTPGDVPDLARALRELYAPGRLAALGAAGRDPGDERAWTTYLDTLLTVAAPARPVPSSSSGPGAWEDGDHRQRRVADVEQQVTSLARQVETAVSAALGRIRPELDGADPLVRRSDRADFQSNVALASAKRVKARPAELAAALTAELEGAGPVAAVEVSGPGFLNITTTDAGLWHQVGRRLAADDLGVERPQEGVRVVVDYSAPNIAKEMHVGHLRTTIIGDSLARVLGRLGATVVRQNHLGDWGTQFGMLIQYLVEHPELPWRHSDLPSGDVAEGASTVSALDGLYRTARAEFEADAAFADRARARVVALQAGDEATLASWREIVEESELTFRQMYHRLGVLLEPADSAGESFYNPWLPEVVDELLAAGVAVHSDGAVVVESEQVRAPDGEPAVLMVQKRDGGYGYDTTDLATLRYRVRDLKADRILYVVDARQALHFRLIFEAARRMGWLTDAVEAVHVAFGTVLGPDGRPFKTRAGGTVRLMHLIDEAVDGARRTVTEREPDLPAGELDRIAEQAGVGAVKYADLSTSRVKDYTFDIDRMVSLTGNTSVYLQYAHARIRSILRRAGDASPAVDPALPVHPAERALVLALDGFGDVLGEVAAASEPHRLCNYLFDTAKAFTDFYENCPVLKADDAVRANRLALCRLTAATLREGLDLLGIAAPDRM